MITSRSVFRTKEMFQKKVLERIILLSITFENRAVFETMWKKCCRAQLKPDGTRRRTGRGKWRGNRRVEWVASTLHTTSQHGVSSITTADAHTSAASSRLNWRPRLFKWTRTFRWKTKSGFCACAITFQTCSTAGQVTDDSMAHAQCILDTQGYRHALRIRNTYCFCTATMVARTCLNVTL